MPLRCLLVDDNPAFLEVACILLKEEGAAEVDVALTLDIAKRKALELRPDVTLVDIDMPEMSGFEIVRELGQNEHAGRLILISAHAPEEFAEMVELSPAICFISKPQLSLRAVERCLAGAQPRSEG